MADHPVSMSTLATLIWFTTFKDARFDKQDEMKKAKLSKDDDLKPNGSKAQFPMDATVKRVKEALVKDAMWTKFQAARDFFKVITASGDIWSPDCTVLADHVLGIAGLESIASWQNFLSAVETEARKNMAQYSSEGESKRNPTE